MGEKRREEAGERHVGADSLSLSFSLFLARSVSLYFAHLIQQRRRIDAHHNAPRSSLVQRIPHTANIIISAATPKIYIIYKYILC